MLGKRDISHYWKLGYAQAGIGAAILLCSFVAGVAAKYDPGLIHLLLPYYLGILMLVQGGVTLYAAKSGKRWPLAVWLIIFFVLFGVMVFTLLMQEVTKLMHYAKNPCWVEYHAGMGDVQCACGDVRNGYRLIRVSGATSVEPCARAQNTLFIMSNCVYAFTFIGLIVNLLMFVMACNDTCCVTCRRVGDVPHFVIPGEPGTSAIAIGETVVTYRCDEQPAATTEAVMPYAE